GEHDRHQQPTDEYQRAHQEVSLSDLRTGTPGRHDVPAVCNNTGSKPSTNAPPAQAIRAYSRLVNFSNTLWPPTAVVCRTRSVLPALKAYSRGRSSSTLRTTSASVVRRATGSAPLYTATMVVRYSSIGARSNSECSRSAARFRRVCLPSGPASASRMLGDTS